MILPFPLPQCVERDSDHDDWDGILRRSLGLVFIVLMKRQSYGRDIDCKLQTKVYKVYAKATLCTKAGLFGSLYGSVSGYRRHNIRGV